MNRSGFFLTIGIILLGALLSPVFLLKTARSLPAKKPSAATVPVSSTDDATLVRSLLAQNLGERDFSFADVVAACSGKKVIPLNDSAVHRETQTAINQALEKTLATLNQTDSPARKTRRINEVSRWFEEEIRRQIDVTPGFQCTIPLTRDGHQQRAGYPDLRIVHLASGTVFYLDPKLAEQSSRHSTFRSFYFEPKRQTLKITEDAVHLVAGIFHDGKSGQWTFAGWQLVDVSRLRVRLKAEFHASNADLYQN